MKCRCTFFHARQDRYRFDKECIRTCHAELVFLHPMGSAGHVVHSGESGRKMSMHYFSCTGGTSMDLTKKRTRTRYAKLVFLHLVVSVGHVVCSCASGQ
jgi:hypothetical protein